MRFNTLPSSLQILLLVVLFICSHGYAQNYPPVFNAATLNGTNGFVVPGLPTSEAFGTEVQFIGDINNDGIEDLAIGDQNETVGALALAGRAYIIFGSTSGFPATFNLTALNGSNGFIVEATVGDERRGESIAGPGDINGDGIDDLIVTGSSSNPEMVIYGRTTFPAVMRIGDINGSNGFIIQTPGSGEVAALGDVNGDGINDFIISNPIWEGTGWVIFGRSGNFPASIDAAWLDGTKGFITSDFPGTIPSFKAGGAGDVNNDGYNDIMLGNWASNAAESFSYILFGKGTPFASVVELTTLNGTDGFRIENAGNGFLTFVGDIGDLNNDGIDDCFSENNIIFGYGGSFPSTLYMSALTGANGFVLNGGVLCAASAGDQNGDGIEDLLVVGSGGDYIVYGKTTGFSALVDPASLDGSNGFTIPTSNNNVGRPIDGGKDLNGDGISDFVYNNVNGQGSVNVVFGGDHFAMPLNTAPSIILIKTDGFNIKVNGQEAGIIRYAVFPEGTPHIADHAIIGNGTGAIQYGTFPLTGINTDVVYPLTGLLPDTKYDIYLYFEDAAGNKDINYHYWDDVKTLPVTDIVPPVLTCAGNQTVGCNATAIPDYTSLVTVSDDKDVSPTVTQSPAAGSAFVNGMIIMVTAEDDAGNESYCTFTVTKAADVVKPIITCPTTKTLTVGDPIPDYTSQATVTDNCDASPTVTQTPVAGTIFTASTTVMLTAQDASGNQQYCTFIINEAADVVAPVLTCAGNQTVTCNATAIPSYISLVTVYDNKDVSPALTQSPAAGSTFTNGMTITITAEDDAGNKSYCMFTVAKAVDADKPLIDCPGNKTLYVGDAIPDYTSQATVTDNCDAGPVVTQYPVAGTIFTASITVTLTAKDVSGNQQTCTFLINEAADVTAPVLSCAGSQTVACNAASIPSYISLVTVYDNKDASPVVTQSPVAGSTFTNGMTVTITAEDDAGNKSYCTFTVTKAADADKPIIYCPANKTLNIGDPIPDYTLQTTATDNCDASPIVTQTPVAGTIFSTYTTVTITAQDASGNQQTCTFIITETPDTEKPLIICPGNQSVECAIAATPDYRSLVSVTDNRDTDPVITQSPAAGSAFTNGMKITITATDKSGNTSACSFTINADKAFAVYAGNDVTITSGESTSLQATGTSAGGIYTWTPAAGLDNASIANPVATPDATITYTVRYASAQGCVAEDRITIIVKDIQIAKGFSPDKDGINDSWVIDGIEKYKENEVAIFNRWGNCIFYMKNYDNASRAFHGDANRLTALGASELPEGTYFYSITLPGEQNPLKGFLVLKK